MPSAGSVRGGGNETTVGKRVGATLGQGGERHPYSRETGRGNTRARGRAGAAPVRSTANPTCAQTAGGAGGGQRAPDTPGSAPPPPRPSVAPTRFPTVVSSALALPLPPRPSVAPTRFPTVHSPTVLASPSTPRPRSPNSSEAAEPGPQESLAEQLRRTNRTRLVPPPYQPDTSRPSPSTNRTPHPGGAAAARGGAVAGCATCQWLTPPPPLSLPY